MWISDLYSAPFWYQVQTDLQIRPRHQQLGLQREMPNPRLDRPDPVEGGERLPDWLQVSRETDHQWPQTRLGQIQNWHKSDRRGPTRQSEGRIGEEDQWGWLTIWQEHIFYQFQQNIIQFITTRSIKWSHQSEWTTDRLRFLRFLILWYLSFFNKKPMRIDKIPSLVWLPTRTYISSS